MAPGRKLRRRVPHRGARGAIVRKRRGQPLHRPRNAAFPTARGAARARRARVSGRPYAEVIGDPIAHSKSPLIHKFWLEKLGIEGDYRATRITPAELPEYLHVRRRDSDWRGCNVTMPLKTEVTPFLWVLDRHAQLLGAVNTIIHDEASRLRGHNTDVNGVAE